MPSGLFDLVPLIFVVGLLAFAVLAVLAVIAAQRRTQELSAVAASLGWRFEPRFRQAAVDQLRGDPMFRRGVSRKASNTMIGELDLAGVRVAAIAGDFTYTKKSSSGGRDSTSTYRFSYLSFECPVMQAPDLQIRREGVMDRVLAAIGVDDIDFESSEFSRRFHVTSDDKRFAYDVIHPRMMEFLIERMTARFSMRAGVCCVGDGDSLWAPHEFRDRIEWCEQFFAHWPTHLPDAMRQDGDA